MVMIFFLDSDLLSSCCKIFQPNKLELFFHLRITYFPHKILVENFFCREIFYVETNRFSYVHKIMFSMSKSISFLIIFTFYFLKGQTSLFDKSSDIVDISREIGFRSIITSVTKEQKVDIAKRVENDLEYKMVCNYEILSNSASSQIIFSRNVIIHINGDRQCVCTLICLSSLYYY